MEKTLTKAEYDRYMYLVNSNIKRLEFDIKMLARSKRISKLTYNEWKSWQEGKIKLSN